MSSTSRASKRLPARTRRIDSDCVSIGGCNPPSAAAIHSRMRRSIQACTIGARESRTLRWRGQDVEFGAGSYYGYATGIVGLRLFPNPNFDQAAADRWDPERYYTDVTYYNDATLVKPYRVGMSCGFCHIGPNPINPPPDPNAPEWQHLSSNVGAQYFWVDRILYWQNKPEDFAFQLFHSSRPGTLDTSFISTDNINNPRSMNAVYLLGARAGAGDCVPAVSSSPAAGWTTSSSTIS